MVHITWLFFSFFSLFCFFGFLFLFDTFYGDGSMLGRLVSGRITSFEHQPKQLYY